MTYLAAAAVLDPLTHCAGPGIKPASWSCRDAIDPVAPQEKLHFPALKIIIIDLRELDVWVYSFLFIFYFFDHSEACGVPGPGIRSELQARYILQLQHHQIL